MSRAHALAPAGSTGNATHDGVFVGGTYDAVAFVFEVSAVGGSPSVTWKVQGSLDGDNWSDVGYITDASDTISTATRAATSVGAQVAFLSNPVARKFNFFRLVTSSNSNVTYGADVHLF
jgi:hypothetical protein